MKNIYLLFIALVVIFSSCKDSSESKRIALLEKQLEEKSSQLDQVQQAHLDHELKTGELMHLVFFQIKEETGEEGLNQIVELLSSLKRVESVKQVLTGTRTETKDPRAKTDYQVALMVQFGGQENLATYQKDTFHLDVRKKVGPMLSGPPVVYDFTLK